MASGLDLQAGLLGQLSLSTDSVKLNVFSGLREGARQLMR